MESGLDARIAATAARQHGAFSRRQTDDLGFSREAVRHRLRTGRWERLSRDVFRLAGAPGSWRQRLMAAVLEAGPGAVASHRAAAVLLGIPGFDDGSIEVTHPECRNTRVRLSVLHQSSLLPDDHVTVRDGIPCTTLARTIFDLARTEPKPRVSRAARTAMQRHGLTIGQLEAVVSTLATRGRGGTKVMRELLDELGGATYVPTESELEDLVVAVLSAAGLELPEGQVTVGVDAPIGRVDFVYRAARVVIEAQSRTFHSSWEAQQADMARRAELAAAGYLVIEVTWWQLVHEPEVFVGRVRRALCAVAA